MGREALRAYLKSRHAAETPETPLKPHETPKQGMGFQQKTIMNQGCISTETPETLETSINTNSREVFQPQPQPGALKPASPASSEQRDPNDWRELAAAYHLHHFKCVVCIAAGRGAGYGPRCGAGAALWVAYQNAP